MATQQIAQGLAGLGRYGDSTLVHMQPEEVAGLQALAKTQGTSLTINPETGLPEAFNLGGFFNALLPVFAGAATGGAGAPLWAGIAAGAATGAVTNRKDPLMGAVMGGMGGYGGFNIGQGFANAGAGAAAPAAGGVQVAGSTVPTGTGIQLGQGAAQQIGTPQLNQALAQSGVNFDPIAKGTAQNIMANTGPGVAFKNTFAQSSLPGDIGYLGQGVGGTDLMRSGAIGSAVPGGSLTAQQSLANAGQGFENLVTGKEGSWDAFKQGLAGAGKAPVSNFSAATTLGMPLGSAVLGGLEPSDLYGEPMRPGQNPNEKYDPYKTLNLNTNTGLKLYAQGGPVSFAEGGAMQGGGSGAMQGGNLNFNTPSGLALIEQQAGRRVNDDSNLPPMVRALSGGPAVPPTIPRMALGAMGGGSENRESSLPPMARLSLYAQGGPVSFADGGDALKGGGRDALKGADALALDVSDINAKYGYDPEGLRKQSANPAINAMAGNIVNMGGFGARGAGQAMPNIAPPQLGLFADNDQIEAARTAYEQQLAAAMAGQGGMGSFPAARFMGQGMGTMSGGPSMAGQPTGIAGLMGSTAPTAPTASTAETSLSRLNLNKQYADGGYVASDMSNPPMLSQDGYGLGRLNSLSNEQSIEQAKVLGYAKGGYLDGPGDGMSDSIPATIEGKQPARLADGEFVIPADVVSHLGNGSTKAGSQRLYGMLDKVRKARTGTKKQGKQINPSKYMPA